MKTTMGQLAMATGICCFSSALMAQVPLPAQGVSTSTTAAYAGVQAVPDADAAGNPGVANSASIVGPGGGTFTIPVLGTMSDESIGMARSSLPGSVGSLSSAGGFSPSFGPGGATAATSFARSVTHWQALSADPSVTTAAIDVLSAFGGTLATVDFAGASMNASVHAELNVITASGVTNVFVADAILRDPPLPSDPSGLTATGPWASSFVAASTSPTVNVHTVQYAEFFDDAFTVNVGETFAWEVVLSTAAVVDGPFELHAIADFLNTGSGDLSVNTPGIMLAVVPEPSVWASMLVGGLLLIGRFRMQSRSA